MFFNDYIWETICTAITFVQTAFMFNFYRENNQV